MKKISKALLCGAMICLVVLGGYTHVEAKKLSVEDGKNAIVEVQTGLETYDGEFYQVKNSSGFLVCNKTNAVYVITTNHTTMISDKEKSKACKKYKLENATSGYKETIRIVVEGDVSVGVSVVANSKEEDFCVLKCDDVLNEKSALHLKSTSELSVGDTVYSLGFSTIGNDADNEYKSSNVEIHTGEIQDREANMSGKLYLQHSAIVLPEQSGGALLSEDGYLVGMSNSAITNASVEVYYSLPIDNVKSILDNYGISYDSKERDDALEELSVTYGKCEKLCNSKSYKSDSIINLKEALQSVHEEMNGGELSLDTINEMNQKLNQAQKSMVKKTPKVKIIKYVLLVAFLLLFVKTVVLLLRYKKLQTSENVPSNASQESDSKKHQVNTKDAIKNKQKEIAKSEECYLTNTKKYSHDLMQTSETNEKKLDKNISEYDSEATMILNYSGNITGFSSPEMSPSNRRFRSNAAVLVSERTGEVYYISKTRFSIGKKDTNDLILDNNAVSREHVVITWNEGTYYITDLDSANGTFLNGKPLANQAAQLHHQDSIMLADEHLIFQNQGGVV